MGSGKTLKEAEIIFVALLVIGLIGLLFLIVFGNLSGNLGFKTILSSENDTMNFDNITAEQLNSTIGVNSPVISNIVVTNATDGQIALPGNYTIVGLTIIATGIDSNVTNIDVFVTYTMVINSQSLQDTEAVIGNLTSGAVQFFSFSNVWFILIAVTILIGIVMGVIALVRKTGGTGKERNSNMGKFTG